MNPNRATAAVLAVIAAVAVVHQLWWWDWFIEDSAISFAYTKHLVQGDGLVAYPGGERVEGYSNFTWVLLLAPFQLLGLTGFESAKPVSAFLTVLTVPVVGAIAWEVDRRRVSVVAAALAFALHSQVAHWHTSGLENALFALLLAIGIWRGAVELRTGEWPLSALAFAALSATRPEAILYGAVAGFLMMVFTLHERRSVRHTLAWLATFFAPWFAYQGWRYWYFGWVFPQTYYAKMNLVTPEPWVWEGRGWKYVRNWAHNTGSGYLLVVFLLGLAGASRWREWRVQAVLGATLLASMAVLFGTELRALYPALVGALAALFYAAVRSGGDRPGAVVTGAGIAGVVAVAGAVQIALFAGVQLVEPPVPRWWTEVPSYTLVTIAVLAPLAAVGADGWRTRLTCWALAAVGVFFAVYSQGDWMADWRWLSLPAVPMCVLFGLGAVRFADLVEDLFTDGQWRAGWAGLVVIFAISGAANLAQTHRAKRDIGPEKIKRRVEYKQSVLERIHYRGRVVDLDVDMGGHMFWFDAELHDIAGLVDIPLAQHKFARRFIRPFLFEEIKPHFAHVHANWAKNSGIPSFSEWKRDYFELPPYRMASGSRHPGNFMRRDLILADRWEGTAGRRAVLGRVVLEGWELPGAIVGVDRWFELHIGVRAKGEARLLAFLVRDGELVDSWDLPLGYDWIPPTKWSVKEVFTGVYDLRLPDGLAEGEYDLGFVALGADGSVLGAESPSAAPVFATGEVVFPGALTVTSLKARGAEARADRDRAAALAEDGACVEAEAAWDEAIAHRAAERDWRDAHAPAIHTALAGCWAQTATGAPDPVDRLVRAQHYDHRHPAVQAVGRVEGARLHAEGLEAFAAEDWETAFVLLDGAATADRTLSWARAKAEVARAHWLGTPRIPGP
ncbi:MAG: hypothetical protein ACI9K2_006970 [Myxococcota bacterium]|jgi:hypothetical protein